MEELASLDSVVSVMPVVAIPRPQPLPGTTDQRTDAEKSEGVADMSTFSAADLGGAAEAHAADYTGKGITIGIIDSGVDYDHPDLGGTG
ncbi:Minor extracellular protease vpr precursor [Actinomyces bovis]|uniref:Minor extracellular protease vpr n=1 Tax=Actinomyces bovis TaxID=1658 RepID=A0ABY1VNN5_9ACTO|nr:Minor extracellular protease vpr precursor [Actinomyces bovis]VEG55853.1 Minor extracellular protease vpr precursor [Actinomyces israelii]